jgi:hypothetical protein
MREAPRTIPADIKEMSAALKKAAVEALRPVLRENEHKLLRSLQDHELEAVVWAVVDAYVKTRDAQEKHERESLNDPVADLFA